MPRSNDIHIHHLYTSSVAEGEFTGSITNILVIGKPDESGSLQRIEYGDLAPTSQISHSLVFPNGTNIGGPIHAVKWERGEFLITYKSRHVPVV